MSNNKTEGLISFDELLDKRYGNIGTPERDQVEYEMQLDILKTKTMRKYVFVWADKCKLRDVISHAELKERYNIDEISDLRNPSSVFDIEWKIKLFIEANDKVIFIIGSPYALVFVNNCLQAGETLKNNTIVLPEHLKKYEGCNLQPLEVEAWEYSISSSYDFKERFCETDRIDPEYRKVTNCIDPETSYIGETAFDRYTSQMYDEFNELQRLTY